MNCLFGSIKVTKNSNLDKYKYTGYGIGYGSHSEFFFTDGSFGKNFIIFGAHVSSSVHVDNKGKYILILLEGPTQGLDGTTFTAKAKYPIGFTQSGKRFVLSLHYNGRNRFVFVNATKAYQFKAKNSEITDYSLFFFSVDFNPFDNNDILAIHKHLMKKP